MARTAKSAAPEEGVTNAKKMEAFDQALKMVNKEISTDSGVLVAKLGDKPMEVETISSGSVVLDTLLGGGFPKGRVIEIYGPEASGKTSMALTAVGNVQRDGGTAVFLDYENALDPAYARVLGVDTNNLAVAQPENAEQGFNMMFKLCESEVVDIIVLDSIASMVPQAEFAADMEQQSIGLLARLMSRGLRKLVRMANKTNTTIIFINQTRDAVGSFSPYGTPQTTPGGKAMKFFASQRIDVRRVGIIKEGKDAIGTEVRLKVVKNKIAPPFLEGKTVLTFGQGINVAAEMIEVGSERGVILRPNSRKYVEVETGEIIGNSKAEALAKLESDEAMLLRLTVRLKTALLDPKALDAAKAAQSEDGDEEASSPEDLEEGLSTTEEDAALEA